MRIKQLEIYGYGKWVDQKFELGRGFHSFLGENEAGKSTLMSFIHSILFGFPTRNSTLLRYEPRKSSKYGGKIIADDNRFGEVIIERTHGKVTGDVSVTLEDGTTGSDELLKTILHDVDQSTYQNIFSFALSDIENVHHLNKNQLSRYLFNIGAHGTEYYLELVDEFRADANELYRPSGRVRPLNKQLAALEEQEKKLNELQKHNESYLDLIKQNSVQETEIKKLENKQNELEKKLENILELKKKWHIYEEIQTLESEISKINLPPLKQDGYFLLEEYKKDISKINTALQELHLEQTAQEETLTNPEVIENYTINEEVIKQLEEDLPEIVELLGEYQGINHQRAENQKQLTILEENLLIQHQSSYPTSFSSAEIKTVNTWLRNLETEEKRMGELKQKIQTIENELNLRHQKLDQLEAIMWDKHELENVKKQLASKHKTQQKKDHSDEKSVNWPFVMGLLAAGGFLFGAIIFESPIRWGFGILSLALFIFSLIVFKKESKKTTETKEETATQSDQFLSDQYQKQLSLKEDWRIALNEVDSIQERLEEKRKQKEEVVSLQKSIENNWQNVLINHQLPGNLPLKQANNIFDETNELVDLAEKDQKISAAQTELKGKLEQKTALISKVIELNDESLVEKITKFREYLHYLKVKLTKEQTKLDKLEKLKQDTTQLKKNKEDLKNKINHLIDATGVQSEAEFIELYKQKEAVDTKTSRLQFLKENIPALDNREKMLTKKEVQNQEEYYRKEVQKVIEQMKQKVRQQANIQVAIEKIEKDGTYTEELQKFENEKATAQSLVDEWISNKLAASVIQSTLNQVTKERFAEIITNAEEYFRLLTNGEYEKINFKNEKLFVQNQEGEMIDVRVLSRGTAEPLYVAIRLAYIVNTKDMMTFPIIMDDPFVNFDQMRKLNMYRLLKKLSKDLQIIYFTFDPEVLSYFSKEQITQLELNEPV